MFGSLLIRWYMIHLENTINGWVAEFTDSLYQRALFKVSDEELAKDLVQETFLTAFEKFDTFEGRSSAKTWLISILNHKIIDHFRRQLRNPVGKATNNENIFFDEDGMWFKDKRPSAWDQDVNLLDDSHFVAALTNCMGKLPKQWFSVIQLKYLSEKEGNEVCKELNIASTNYWQIIRRAKLNLRECLDINWFKQ